jgi:hypothetical protein
MIKNLLVLAISFLSAVALFGAQIGDTVESKVPIQNRVTIGNNQILPVTQINLDSGVWLVDGLIDFFAFNIPQSCYIGAAIDTEITISVDGTGLFSTVSSPPGISFPGLALPGKTVEISTDGTPVFLNGWRFSGDLLPHPTVQAWGFISATKIRNHH